MKIIDQLFKTYTMELQDVLFVMITFIVIFAWFVIQVYFEAIRTFLVGFVPDLWYKEMKIECRLRRVWKFFKKWAKLTTEEEKKLDKESFNEPLGVGA